MKRRQQRRVEAGAMISRQAMTFTVLYPGSAASSNSYAPGGRRGMHMPADTVVFKESVTWMAKAALMVSLWIPKPSDRIKVTVQGRFPNHVHSDVSNLIKYVADGIEDALNARAQGKDVFNDRDWQVEALAPQYDPGQAHLVVTLEKE